MIEFYGYKKCSTCRKAEAFLEKKKLKFKFIDITEKPPTKTLLKKVLKLTGEPIRKLLNTSGIQYRELGLKDKVPSMKEEDILDLLSKNGKLVKRPIAYDGKKASIGFKEDVYKEVWKKS